ncbi:MAG TPA: alpha/beta hydrolase [Propionibacteriaceae bacterium]|nr:alpha/beta hydrolase [Propionibacteriaceae bacterium]
MDIAPPYALPRLRRNQDRRGTHRHLSRPTEGLDEHWTTIDGVEVFYRSAPGPPGAPVMTHLHGFGLSGRYLLPTAQALAGDFRTFVPDLPGFGRSGDPPRPPGLPELAREAADFLTDRGVARSTLVGNSLGCTVVCEFAHQFPDRVDRAILVSPAGGPFNQPLRRAVRQLLSDSLREPPRLLRVAVPDYLRFGVSSTLRLFEAITRYPTLDRLLDLSVPTLVVVGNCDPLLPEEGTIVQVARDHLHDSIVVVVLEGAAHAVNFSHPEELATLIRRFMADLPLELPNEPGGARAYEIYRGEGMPRPAP